MNNSNSYINKKTSIKRPLTKRGAPAFRGAQDGNPFTTKNQPTGKQKSEGWLKKKLLKDMLGLSTSANFQGSKTDYRKLTAEYLGIQEKEVTIKMVMEFRQIEKAILKGDTSSFNSIMDRAFGRPKQALEHTGQDGKEITLRIVRS